MELKPSLFCCPVCKDTLFIRPDGLRCFRGHHFDKAKQGYVNLLRSNSSGGHGDDKLMVAARSHFLNKDFYAPLRDAVTALVGEGHTVLDAGCGEGYYTAGMAEKNAVCGVDISKEALKVAARRVPQAQFAVASVSALPLADAGVDTVINIFAPDTNAEYLRVLQTGGRLITVQPCEEHLWELKAAVYDTPYKNPAPKTQRDGFRVVEQQTVDYTMTLDTAADIAALFQMTPYYYKTSRADQQKLASLTTLTTRVEFLITVYEKT